MLRIIHNKKSLLAASLCFWLFPVLVSAQGLTLSVDQSAGPAVGAINYTVIALLLVRLILAAAIVFAGILAVYHAYIWLNHEGNMAKAYEGKESLGKMVLIITVCFILMSLFRIFVPDYSLLAL